MTDLPRHEKLMTIPEVRNELYALAETLDSEKLRYLADQLWRRPAGRQAPYVSRTMTPELAQHIRDYAVQHPDVTEHRISILFGVNQGRVSEALFGKREES